VIVAGKIIFIGASIYPVSGFSACFQRLFSAAAHAPVVPSSKEEKMSKLMKATLVGLAAAAFAAPLAQADAFAAPGDRGKDVGRPADVGRPNDAFRVDLGRRMNPMKLTRLGPSQVRSHPMPWASRNKLVY
jgi:hypothetical protein